MRPSSTAASVVAAALCAATAARAEHVCTEVDAPIVTTYSFAGCTSPVGICTTGTTQLGSSPATTSFTALSVTQGPTPETMFYTGELTITTRFGSLRLRDFGILNTTTGQFFELEQVVSGTRQYSNVKGALVSQGTATGTGFAGTLNGELCRVLRGALDR